MKIKTQRSGSFAPAVAVLALGLAAAARGQTAPSDQTVQMDPFVVNTAADHGYIAIDSLAGGRNDMPVRITPSVMSSLTRTFIDDVQITDVRQALQWTLNVVPVSWNSGHDGGGDVFNPWAYNIRGAGTGPQGGNPPTVNYFPFYGVKDLFNVARIEVDRGPDSILFGVGNFGGTISTYTNTPRFDANLNQLNLRFTNWGGARVTADVNRVASVGGGHDNLGLRLDILGDRDAGWRKEDITKRWGASLATTWKITAKTTVRLDLEGYHQETPQFAVNLTDGFSQWDHTTNSPTWAAAPVGSAHTNSMAEWGGPASTQVWIPELGSLMNWGAGYRGAGIGDGPYYTYTVLRPDAYTIAGGGAAGLSVPALPSRDFTVGPTDGKYDWEYYTATAYLDQMINEHSEFELSAYRYADQQIAKNFESPGFSSVDINKQLPNGQANPLYGQIYSDMFLDRQIQDHSANEFRGQFNYHFDFDVGSVPIKEWLSASGGAEMHLLRTRQYIATLMNGYNPNTWTANMVWAREYWNQPNDPINLPSQVNGDPIIYLPLPFNWFDHDLVEQIKYGGLVSQTRVWDDRLNVTLGARHDNYWSQLNNVRGTGNIPAIESDSGTTYSAGVVAYVLPALGLTYNFSQNFAPIGGGVAPSLFGDQFGPATGKSNAGGIRLSTPDRNYYISADYYEDTAHGRISNDHVDFQGIWNDYFKAGGTATDIGPAGTVTGTASPNTLHANMSFADTQDVKDSGYEIDATANPLPNLRIQAGLAFPKSVSDNDLPGSRAYYAAHISEWTPVATGGNPLAGQVASDLARAQTTLANTAASKTNAGLVKSTFNIFGDYTFQDGPLTGIDVGAGATALGKQNISTGGTLESPAYTIYYAKVGYSTEVRPLGHSIHVKLQLNVDNLTNVDRLVYTGYNTFSGGVTQGSSFNFIPPRKFTFSAAFEF